MCPDHVIGTQMGEASMWQSHCVVTVQSTGWPGVVAVMSHWFGKQRLVRDHMPPPHIVQSLLTHCNSKHALLTLKESS